MKALQTIASTWRRDHRGAACPTPESLRAAHEIDPVSKLTDAWDGPFIIACDRNATTASSAGADGIADTADDVRFPLQTGTRP